LIWNITRVYMTIIMYILIYDIYNQGVALIFLQMNNFEN
jgi:hypothetical protein